MKSVCRGLVGLAERRWFALEVRKDEESKDSENRQLIFLEQAVDVGKAAAAAQSSGGSQ